MSASVMEKQQDRETMIRALVPVLEGRGYVDIRVARLEEYAGCRPAVVLWESSDEGYHPDITARKNRNDYLFQVENGETLSGSEAEQKMVLFAAYARHYRKQFCLAVPAVCRRAAKEKMGALQIDERFAHVLGM